MTQRIETAYDEQVLRPNSPPRLEPNTQVEIKMVRMNFSSHKQRHLPLVAAPAPTPASMPAKPADVPECLDHYLFW